MRIVDIRIKQIDLPTDSRVIGDVYDRMRAQRQQVASRLRAEGEEQANQIRAKADRDRAVILAEAERDAQTLRGEGDAEATRYMPKRRTAIPRSSPSSAAWRPTASVLDGDNVIVLERDDPFLQYMRSDR
jgi:membrane protease subunit HflC